MWQASSAHAHCAPLKTRSCRCARTWSTCLCLEALLRNKEAVNWHNRFATPLGSCSGSCWSYYVNLRWFPTFDGTVCSTLEIRFDSGLCTCAVLNLGSNQLLSLLSAVMWCKCTHKPVIAFVCVAWQRALASWQLPNSLLHCWEAAERETWAFLYHGCIDLIAIIGVLIRSL
jgi:hypothetical protein